jgi:uncharacterized lipoprotein
MRIAGIVIATLLSTALSTGCVKKLSECKHTDKDYAGAKEMPPLKAPPGLQDPDTRNALRVPPLDTPERIRGKNEPCLDAPPPFANPKTPEAPKAG